jgi:hypothetical protein
VQNVWEGRGEGSLQFESEIKCVLELEVLVGITNGESSKGISRVGVRLRRSCFQSRWNQRYDSWY